MKTSLVSATLFMILFPILAEAGDLSLKKHGDEYLVKIMKLAVTSKIEDPGFALAILFLSVFIFTCGIVVIPLRKGMIPKGWTIGTALDVVGSKAVYKAAAGRAAAAGSTSVKTMAAAAVAAAGGTFIASLAQDDGLTTFAAVVVTLVAFAGVLALTASAAGCATDAVAPPGVTAPAAKIANAVAKSTAICAAVFIIVGGLIIGSWLAFFVLLGIFFLGLLVGRPIAGAVMKLKKSGLPPA